VGKISKNIKETTGESEDRVIYDAIAEEDVPLKSHSPKRRTNSSLPFQKIEEKRENRRYGYKIIIGCLIILGIILIADNIVSLYLLKEASKLNSIAIDLIKTIVLFVLGYMFGRSGNGAL
jgi:hypothetical protein